MGKLYEICNKIMLLMYINLLWVIFTILGLGIFGLMPATTAVFAVAQQQIQGNDTESTLGTFWKNYKKQFLFSNKVGILLLLIGYSLYFFLQFFHIFNFVIYILFATLLFCYFLMIIYIFPVLVYEENRADSAAYIKKAFTISLTNPVPTVMIILWAIACYLIYSIVPFLIVLFSVSTLAFIIMYYSDRIFNKLESEHYMNA